MGAWLFLGFLYLFLVLPLVGFFGRVGGRGVFCFRFFSLSGKRNFLLVYVQENQLECNFSHTDFSLVLWVNVFI